MKESTKKTSLAVSGGGKQEKIKLKTSMFFEILRNELLREPKLERCDKYFLLQIPIFYHYNNYYDNMIDQFMTFLTVQTTLKQKGRAF